MAREKKRKKHQTEDGISCFRLKRDLKEMEVLPKSIAAVAFVAMILKRLVEEKIIMGNGTSTAFSPLKSNKGRHLRMRNVRSFPAMIMPGKPKLKLTAYNKTRREKAIQVHITFL